MDGRIAITGLGPITAIGIGKEELWRSIKNGKSRIVLHHQYLGDEYWGSFFLARVDDFDIEKLVAKNDPDSIWERAKDNTDLHYLLGAVKLALEDSGLTYDPHDNDIGLVLTHENPGVDRYTGKVWDVMLTILNGRLPLSPNGSKVDLMNHYYDKYAETVYDMQTFMYLYYVSRVLGLHGYSLFINNACASGLYAIEAASHAIRAGDCRAVIVAGADNPVLITKYLWFKKLGLYAEDGVMRPFDRRRAGFIFGDGGGALVVEDFEHAVRRNARIYAEYLGGGFNQDAWKVSLPDVEGDYYGKSLRKALASSKVRPEEIDLVNPHGAATWIADRYEARVIVDVFGEFPDRPLITAFKPYVGHNLGGSAMVELIILLLALNHNFVPATLNCTEPDPALKLRLVSEPVEKNLNIVAKMSSGFGGYNAVAVFKKVER